MKTAKRILTLLLTLALCLAPLRMTTYAQVVSLYLIDHSTGTIVSGSGAVYILYRQDGSAWEQIQVTPSYVGFLRFDSLVDGDYKLVENRPPLGYVSNPSPIYFTVHNGNANIRDIVYQRLPNITIPVLHITDIDLGTQVLGAMPEATEILIINISGGDASNVAFTLSGPDSSAFTVSQTEIASIQAFHEEIVTIIPAAHLPVRTYSAQLKVDYKDNDGVDYSTTANITYEVLPIAHTITATAGTGGSISPSEMIYVNDNEDQTFTITAYEGYKISDVKVDGVSEGAISTYQFENVNGNHTIHAEFAHTGTTAGGTEITGSTTAASGSRSSYGSSSGTTARPGKSSVEARHLGDYSWSVDLPVLGFVEASVDGDTLTRGEDYTVCSGSTILTLTDSYVNSLRSGSHTLRMEFLSATATIDFTVTPTGSGGGDVGEPNAPALASNDNMNPNTGGVEDAGSVAVLLAVAGLWAAHPMRFGK